MRVGLIIAAIIWVIVLVGYILLTSCNQQTGVLIPPARYQKSDVWVSVHFVPDPKVECERLGLTQQPGQGVAECGVPGKFIVMPDPCHYSMGDQHADWECHAVGHFLGWPADHPK